MPRKYLAAAFWLACLAVGALSLLPATAPMPTTGWDKSNHALAFAVLGVMGSLCWPGRLVRLAFALCAYGGAIEIAQATLTTTRMGEWSDWLADSVGLGLAFAIVMWRRRGAKILF